MGAAAPMQEEPVASFLGWLDASTHTDNEVNCG